uniref:HTH cro/C1-type domain-containing protein n=1 Tax=uncultured Gemmatimonadales bacterium HF0770_11C06 TaxID=723616 RepID=E7C6Y6_9BACT|nr:hypothetical protein [uncultured Gemmatimonadales bacterium HF0770_11C06]
MLTTHFGSGIRQRRRTRNVSLRRLAQDAGLSGAYLSQIERGLVPPPSSAKIKALAVALGESPDELIGLAGQDRMQQLQGWVLATLTNVGTKKPKRDPAPKTRSEWCGGVIAWNQAIQTLQTALVAGLAHGDFEFTIRGARTTRGNSTLTLNLGTVHQFTLATAEIDELGFLFGSGQRVKSRKARR